MKYLKSFDSQESFERYMSGEEGEVVFPTVSLVNSSNSDVKFYQLLPNVDTTNYATTFTNGNVYSKEASLFKNIVNTFLEGYDLTDADPVIWMDLSEATVDILLFGNRQMFSIADEPLYKNYLSKITNFCDEEGVPTSTLNLFEDVLTVEEYIIDGENSRNVSMNLNFNTGLFESI